MASNDGQSAGIGSVFSRFVRDNIYDPSAGGSVAPAAPAASKNTISSAAAMSTGSSVVGAPSVDPEMLTTLQNVVNARKTAYTALLETADKMVTFIPDSDKRLAAAWAAISNGRLPSDVISSIDLHISDVRSSAAQFNSSANAQRTQRVDSLNGNSLVAKKRADEARTRAEQLRAEASKLDQVAADADTEAATLAQQAIAADAEIKDVHARFELAVSTVITTLETQKSAIQSVIKC